MPNLPPALENIYEQHYKNDSQPKYIELVDIFSTIIYQFDCIFLVLDALDECTLDQRRDLCGFILGITKTNDLSMATAAQDTDTALTDTSQKTMDSRGILKLFITSRRESDLERAFLRNSIPTIEMEATKVDRDIEDYVKAQIQQRLQDGRLGLKNIALAEKILTTLTTKAGGMYVFSSIYIN